MLKGFRHRLALWHAMMFGLALVAGGLALYLAMRGYLLRKVDASLLALADAEVSSAFDDPDREIKLLEPWSRAGTGDLGAVNHLVQVTGLDGQRIARSQSLEEFELPLSPKEIWRAASGQVFFRTLEDATGEPFRMVTVPVRMDGQIRYVLQVGTPLYHVEMTLRGILRWLFVIGAVGLIVAALSGYLLAWKTLRPIQVITEQAQLLGRTDLSKRLESSPAGDEISRLIQVLNEMLARIEAGVESQRQFVAGASHEIRTPLSHLKGEIEVALRQPRDPEEYCAVLRSNLEEVNRLAVLAGDLLTLARFDSGWIRLHRKVLDFAQVVQLEVDRFQAKAERRGQAIAWDSEGVSMIKVDEDLVRLLVANLIDNALKYSPDGGIIEVTIKPVQRTARLSVSDNGPGIPPEDLERIFERFYRGERPRHNQPPGTGLGLSICRWIAEAHGGRIYAGNREESGSTFVVDLPLRRLSGPSVPPGTPGSSRPPLMKKN
jgi:two-component system OmpR family sensor kinase